MTQPPPQTDGQLLAQFCADHSQAAFTELVNRHGAMVHGVALRVLADHHEAQDVMQAVFLTLARKAAVLRRSESVGGWLHTVAWRLAMNAQQSRRSRQQREATAMRDQPTVTAAAHPDAGLFRAELDAALGDLPERYRQPVVLFHLEAKSLEETAQRLGLNLKTAGTRLTRARELLRKKLVRRGVRVGSVGALTALLSAESGAAVLPSTIVASTVSAATGGTVSTTVAALSQGALHMLFMANMKLAAMVTTATLLVGGVGATTYVALANAASNATSPAPATAAAWPFWDGKESVPQYAKRARLLPAAPATAPSVIADLIGKLDSDDFRTREEATRKLGEMGETARSALERAAGSGNAEVAMRARRALDALDAGDVQLVLDSGNQVTMKLTLIPAGKFLMGSPETEQGRYDHETRHEVTITKPFYMGIFEVTQAQYEAIAGRNPSQFAGPQKPVEGVSWNDAVEFCRKLSQKTGRTVRLPTEAQWEWACRAGTQTAFNTGDTIGKDQARLGGGARPVPGNVVETGTEPAGSFKPNAWGLYDMHGNVFEWCADLFGEYPKGAMKDPAGPANGRERVVRGGSHRDHLDWCRAAFRCAFDPGIRDKCVGFRVCLDLP